MCSLSSAAASFRNRPLETAQRSSLRGFLTDIDNTRAAPRTPLQLLRPMIVAACQTITLFFLATQGAERWKKKQLLLWRRTVNTYTCSNPIGPSVTHQLHLKPQLHTHTLGYFLQIELLMPLALASAGSAPTIISPSESLIYFEKTLRKKKKRHAPSCGTVNIRYKPRLHLDFGPWRDQTTEERD